MTFNSVGISLGKVLKDRLCICLPCTDSLTALYIHGTEAEIEDFIQELKERFQEAIERERNTRDIEARLKELPGEIGLE